MSEGNDIPRISGYVSVKEAAEILDVSDKMIYFYIENKRLHAVRASNILLIPTEELERFQQKSVGRPRTRTPSWKIASKDNTLFVTLINVQIYPKMHNAITEKLNKIKHEGIHNFPGTVSRYIISYATTPEKIEILLIWKTSVAPGESIREQALEEFRQTLSDVVDWKTARYEEGTVLMHA
jgi:excisionase family DNA binding protein